MKIIAFLLVFTAFTLRTFALVSWRNLPRSNRLGSCFAKQSFAISRLENGKQPSSGIGDENGKQRPGPPAGETKRRPLKPKRNYSNGTNGDGKGDAQKPKRNYSNGTDSDGKGDAQKRRRASSQKPLTRNQILSSVEQSGSAKEINTWMQKLASNTLTKNESSPFQSWSVKDQNEFIRLLKGRGAYQAIVTFMEHLGEQNVSLYTTSIFALAMSPSHRKEAVSLLDLMDSRGIQPTSLTFVALIGAIDGPAATVEMMKRIDQYKKVPYMLEVFHSAIYACCRIPAGATSPERDWQTAISFFQQMRRKRIAPTTKTYAALMQVLSRTGQIKITLSLLRELQVTPGLRADDRVWGAAINVCAQAGDYREAIALINEMNESGYRANLRHCSTFLKALAKAGQEKLALQALEMMLGQNDTAISSGEEELQVFYLPPTPPDLVAVNTVMAACSKAGNFNATKVLFERLKAGEFIDPATDKPISPDGISYHTVLVSCRRPELARELVKEVRAGITTCVDTMLTSC
jgi:pentatricopeptide repeat protein